MNKENKMIEKYRNLINYFTNMSKQSTNQFLAEISKEFVVDFVSKLAKYEKKDKAIYEKMIEQVNGDKTKFVYEDEIKTNDTTDKKVDSTTPTTPPEIPKDNKDAEYFNYLTNVVHADTYLSQELALLTEKIIEDLNNPNDQLIEVWVKNYKDFVVRNNLKEEYMIKYMIGIFEKYDLNRNYINDIEELYEQIVLEEPKIDETKTTENGKKNPEDETKLNKQLDDENKKEDDKKVGDSLDTTEPNKDDETKKTDEDEIEKNNETKKGEDSKKVDSISSGTPQPIKIVSTKKAFLNSGEKLGVGVAAIACLSTPFITPAVLVAYMVYKLRKNHKYKNDDLENFLIENNFNIDSANGQLYEVIEKEDGSEEKVYITDRDLEKAEYSHVKKELMRLGAIKSGLIPEEYKKNKYLQVLMKLNPVKKLKNIKDKYIEKLKEINEQDSYLEQKDKEREFKRGMRGL